MLGELANLAQDRLTADLYSDHAKKAFWINIYNAFIQLRAREWGPRMSDEKKLFFTSKHIEVASLKLSFDDIEHGILRKGQFKYSLGFVKKFWRGRNLDHLMVDQVDYRIHFALNCAAAGCPAIAFYSKENIEQELADAEKVFIDSDVVVSTDGNEVSLSKLWFWYLGDFGGFRGIKRILRKVGVVDNESVRLRFVDYDWSLQLDKYREYEFLE